MTPRHDPFPASSPRWDPLTRAVARAALPKRVLQAVELLRAEERRRKRGPDAAGEPCPVEPNRPLGLSGGAAAPLEFDD